MSKQNARQIIVEELVGGGHTRSSAEYLVDALVHSVRADALEEAASICPCRGNAIRALKDAKP